MCRIDIVIGDVTDVAAHVFARYAGPREQGVVLSGTVHGPFCEGVRTLAAEFSFREVESADDAVRLVEAIVTDPCLWSLEMPHLYNVHVEARAGERVLAAYHGKIGLRRLAPRRPVDFARGRGEATK